MNVTPALALVPVVCAGQWMDRQGCAHPCRRHHGQYQRGAVYLYTCARCGAINSGVAGGAVQILSQMPAG